MKICAGEAEARLASFNSTLSDYKADMLHLPTTQVEEWLYGGNEKPQDVSRVYLRYGVVLFILLLVPALNLSSITFSRMRKRVAELGVRRAFGATKRDIVSQVLLENLVLTLAGGLLGLVLSFFSLWLLRDWLLTTSLGEAGLSARHVQRLCVLGGFSLLPGDEPDVGGYSGMAGVEGEYYGLYKQLMAYVTNDLHTTLE